MSAADDEDLASEYVLGTLSASERAAFERALARDAALRARVADLEQRLAPLALSAVPVPPPPGLWRALERGIGPDVVDLRRRLRGWQIASGVSMAVAASLAALLVLKPPLTGPTQNYVAVVNRSGDLPALIVRVDVASGEVRVRPVSMEAPTGRSMELWYIRQGDAPRSLGLVGADGREMPMPSAMRDGMRAPVTFAVSLEPPGGSPTGGPTGPVVYSGKLIPE